jgi:adenine-specific DNA-methyltransferase
MRYLGSKFLLSKNIFDILSNIIPDGIVCDPFGGIGVIGSIFKRNGYVVYTGDILKFAHFFQVTSIELNRTPYFLKIRKELGLRSIEELKIYLNNKYYKNNWFVEEYSIKRKFFTVENAKKIGSCINLISYWCKNNLLTYREKAYLISSLINSMDTVANTAGTYYAYLKNYTSKSLKTFSFKMIIPVKGRAGCKSFNCDAKKLLLKNKFDIIYLDPPYNERSYAHYYHLPETISILDKPILNGKCGMPLSKKPASLFNRKTSALNELNRVLKNLDFKLLAFHYADNGIINREEIIDALSPLGKTKIINLKSRGYSTSKYHPIVNHSLYLVKNA